ncbi:DNA-processing protein DprA [Bacillus sp. JCM 19034]|uniref:DNA-processing protein DprA n=1 Tax=Bacillus sp. JCM 19034 TaxID=1481928 RepID=UPI0007815BB2|nr:DNA-processing protein DprA [Bacillus sp. JCM 19034]
MDDTEWRARFIHLHSCRGMTWKLFYSYLKIDPGLENIYSLTKFELQTIFQLKSERAAILIHDLHICSSNELLRIYEKQQITPITCFDTYYPTLLKEIHDPPFVLYVKGNHHYLNNSRCMAVIGTRNPSHEAAKKVMHVIKPLAIKNWTIISGLAIGIDTLAHQAALLSKGKTIAVLGAGFHHIYPKRNEQLFQEMSKNNCIITEYPPHIPPRKWHFPARNRIISGLSKAIIVIEANEKSGSLITADQALEQGRDVFAVPGSIFSNTSRGTNKLIQEGAKLVLHATDILTEFPEDCE